MKMTHIMEDLCMNPAYLETLHREYCDYAQRQRITVIDADKPFREVLRETKKHL